MQPPLPQEVADVLAQAAACADALDVDGAINLYNQVLAKAPKCLHALNGLGDALLQRGDREGAIAALRQSVLISPEGDADRYMNLGQLEEGADALLFSSAGSASFVGSELKRKRRRKVHTRPRRRLVQRSILSSGPPMRSRLPYAHWRRSSSPTFATILMLSRVARVPRPRRWLW